MGHLGDPESEGDREFQIIPPEKSKEMGTADQNRNQEK